MSGEILGLFLLGALLAGIFVGFPIAFTLIVLSVVFGGAVFTRLGTSTMLAEWLLGLGLPETALLVLLMGVIFLLGWPLEWPAIIFIFLPIFLPVVQAMEIDLVWFSGFRTVGGGEPALPPSARGGGRGGFFGNRWPQVAERSVRLRFRVRRRPGSTQRGLHSGCELFDRSRGRTGSEELEPRVVAPRPSLPDVRSNSSARARGDRPHRGALLRHGRTPHAGHWKVAGSRSSSPTAD